MVLMEERCAAVLCAPLPRALCVLLQEKVEGSHGELHADTSMGCSFPCPIRKKTPKHRAHFPPQLYTSDLC